jgi:GNAT superfamily N-acetyltransferase
MAAMWSLGKLFRRHSKEKPANGSQVAAQEGASQPYPGANIQLTDDPGDGQFVEASLIRYNFQRAGPSNFRALTVSARDDSGQLIGGIAGSTYWGWLIINCLWIHESWRGRGLGASLLRAAEQEAIARGCHSSQLESFSFQNWQFYEASGYERYATLDDFPFEQQRISYRKRLGRTVTEKRMAPSPGREP